MIRIRWTTERLRELEAQIDTGKPISQVAEAMGSTFAAIQSRMRISGLRSKAARTPRPLTPDHELRERWAAIMPRLRADLRAEIEGMQP